MKFASDLDGLTLATSAVVVLANLLGLGLTWRAWKEKRPIKFNRAFGIPLGLSLYCFPLAYDAYCPDADQPHIRYSGPVYPISRYTYHAGKSSHEGIICWIGAGSGTGTYLEFDEHAVTRVSRAHALGPLSVVYLGRAELAQVKTGSSPAAHPVVEIDDSVDGRRLFYRDTTRHWPRVIVLLTDALLGILSLVLCLRMCGASTAQDDSVSELTTDSENELTGLGLSTRE